MMKGVQPKTCTIQKIYRGRPGDESAKSAQKGGGGGEGLDPPPPALSAPGLPQYGPIAVRD